MDDAIWRERPEDEPTRGGAHATPATRHRTPPRRVLVLREPRWSRHEKADEPERDEARTRHDAPPPKEDRDAEKDAKDQDRHGKDGDEAKDETPPTPRWKKILYAVIGLAILAVLVTVGVLYWLHARHFESTDDAFVDAYMSQVSPQVAGRVLQLAVTDNQHVEAGQLIIALDPRDYQMRVDQARAQLATSAAQAMTARAELVTQRASLEQQQAQVRVAEADLSQAQQDLARFRAISAAAVSRQQVDQANSTTRATSARLDAARQVVVGGRAQIETQGARIEAAESTRREAEANLRNAELQLSYTRIVAPQAGRITRRTVNLGNYVSPGLALLAVVPDEMWVTANFKETQLTDMRPGQAVRITVDAYPDQPLQGHVDSIQRGTGAVFSSLPAENATGNYVKVVQRVPVRILFDGDDWRHLPLAPGLSVSPRVTVR